MSSSSVRKRHTFGPGEVWTASGHFAVDAIRAQITWVFPPNDAPYPRHIVIEEVHELNIAKRRHNRHTGVSLLRSVHALKQEGITFLLNKKLHTILAPDVQISTRFHVRNFVLDDPRFGPFERDHTEL